MRGIPEGTVLGPILFIMFVNDINDFMHFKNVANAGVTTILINDREIQRLNDLSEEVLNQAEFYFASINFCFSRNKTQKIAAVPGSLQ